MDFAELRPDKTREEIKILLNFTRRQEAEQLNVAICCEDPDELSSVQSRISGLAEECGIQARYVLANQWRDLLTSPDLGTFAVVFISEEIWNDAMPEIQRALLKIDSACPTKSDRKIVLCLMKKPLSEKSCFKALKLAAARASVKIPTKEGPRSVLVRDLIYFENVGRKATARTLHGDFATQLTMAQVKRLMRGYDYFICPYVSFLINLHYVRAVSRRDVILRGNIKIPLSEKRAAEFRKIYRRFLSCKNS